MTNAEYIISKGWQWQDLVVKVDTHKETFEIWHRELDELGRAISIKLGSVPWKKAEPYTPALLYWLDQKCKLSF